MFSPHPLLCAERQLERDRAATQAFPWLWSRKLARMTASPLGYLRGAAGLFYELLADHPELAEGPEGEGWLVGDAHLENFGAFRSADGRGAEAVVFDVNDFDEAIVGPFRWDVVRLLTSVILGGREIGSNGMQSVGLCAAILEGYAPALCQGQAVKDVPLPVRRLLDKVERRKHKDLLDHRTERTATGRRFTRGDRYRDLVPDMVGKAQAAFARYVEQLDPQRAQAREHFIVEDVAFRIAGTGSLGMLRIAVLTRGKGELDSRWIFDMKAQGTPAAAALLGAPPEPEPPAERVEDLHVPRVGEHCPLRNEFVAQAGKQLFQEFAAAHQQSVRVPALRHARAVLGLVRQLVAFQDNDIVGLAEHASRQQPGDSPTYHHGLHEAIQPAIS